MENSGQLWVQARQRTAHALRCGALQSIPTQYEFVEQGGVRFLVRILANLARKEHATKQQEKRKANGEDFNPFLPYEDDLFVTNLSSTHLCLLNKFNVVDHHLLIVTREFESQDSWLNHHDFAALWMGLMQIDGLAFYNGGKIAGASQKHKHLQLIPMPLAPEGRPIPIEAVLPDPSTATPGSVSQLPFHHAFTPLTLDPATPPAEAAVILMEHYHLLLQLGGISKDDGGDRHSRAYNLLATRRWMLLVPRIQENTHSISINSLGFAGSLFVKDQIQLDFLKEQGPMTLLQNVGRPLDS